ncbi:MAG: type IV secretion system DNA-binding domain-containing protein [Candidatus Sungbacteria bacterium]|uniref:Type IV secretion system DNA-binding domain-containing protein n=1 Tax=Candidatus Sungiibacteriota bacterium TaxID=2750080 RepID=A0A931SD71_9BACT|nr:type IV secretion system DNA-binding domain-containing protein [Candidatus Sungbacteria bacterium]
MENSEVTYFAETTFRNSLRRFGIKRADRRRHMYIIGKTGTGKTTLLDNMTVQDIQRGNGVAVIDPHGEYAERMLSFIPASRIDDVVYFNPSDLQYPIGFNMLEKPPLELRHFVSSGLMGVFKKLWPDVWSARMEYFLSNSILAHLEIENSTLIGVNRIFSDREYRKSIVAGIQDPIVKGFWENEFAKLPEQFMREAVAAIQNKVGQFISNPLIRNIIGQTGSTFDLREIMDKKKILIANLSKGKIGEENSKLLGALLVTRIYLTAMSRVDVPEDEREDFYVYVDEFQNFATESFASILSEARKYRLSLTLAHQYMGQLVDDKTKSAMLQQAILGNVGTLVSFRIGAEDAEVLEKEFEPEFLIQDFVNLGFAQIYLKLMIDNVASRPFSARTLPPIPPPPENQAREIIKRSQARYGRSAAEIERSISEWSSALFVHAGGAFAATAAQPSRRLAQASPEGTIKPKPKKEEKLYSAKCAVDGADILVPFQPDGRRPVYCQEHLSQIQRGGASQSSRQTSSGPRIEPSRQNRRESGLKPMPSAPIVRVARDAPPLSLNQLRPKDTGRTTGDDARGRPKTDMGSTVPVDFLAPQPHPSPKPPKKEVDLNDLRRVLKESLATAEKEPQIKAQETIAPAPSPTISVPPSPLASQAGIIKPGESIKF